MDHEILNSSNNNIIKPHLMPKISRIRKSNKFSLNKFSLNKFSLNKFSPTINDCVLSYLSSGIFILGIIIYLYYLILWN